MAVHTRVFETG